MVKLVTLEREINSATGFGNLKNSNPSSLVHDGIVKAEYGYIIVVPFSFPALKLRFYVQNLP